MVLRLNDSVDRLARTPPTLILYIRISFPVDRSNMEVDTKQLPLAPTVNPPNHFPLTYRRNPEKTHIPSGRRPSTIWKVTSGIYQWNWGSVILPRPQLALLSLRQATKPTPANPIVIDEENPTSPQLLSTQPSASTTIPTRCSQTTILTRQGLNVRTPTHLLGKEDPSHIHDNAPLYWGNKKRSPRNG